MAQRKRLHHGGCWLRTHHIRHQHIGFLRSSQRGAADCALGESGFSTSNTDGAVPFGPLYDGQVRTSLYPKAKPTVLSHVEGVNMKPSTRTGVGEERTMKK